MKEIWKYLKSVNSVFFYPKLVFSFALELFEQKLLFI